VPAFAACKPALELVTPMDTHAPPSQTFVVNLRTGALRKLSLMLPSLREVSAVCQTLCAVPSLQSLRVTSSDESNRSDAARPPVPPPVDAHALDGLTALLSTHKSLTALALITFERAPLAQALEAPLRALSRPDATPIADLLLWADSPADGQWLSDMVRSRPRVLRKVCLSGWRVISTCVPAAQSTRWRLLIELHSTPRADEQFVLTEAMRVNPLLLVRWGGRRVRSCLLDGPHEQNWFSACIAGGANWQALVTAIAAVRAHPFLGLSILPLLPTITRLAAHIPFVKRLPEDVVVVDAVPTVAVGRFMQTRFVASLLAKAQRTDSSGGGGGGVKRKER
jgi:hypothetical protein